MFIIWKLFNDRVIIVKFIFKWLIWICIVGTNFLLIKLFKLFNVEKIGLFSRLQNNHNYALNHEFLMEHKIRIYRKINWLMFLKDLCLWISDIILKIWSYPFKFMQRLHEWTYQNSVTIDFFVSKMFTQWMFIHKILVLECFCSWAKTERPTETKPKLFEFFLLCCAENYWMSNPNILISEQFEKQSDRYYWNQRKKSYV